VHVVANLVSPAVVADSRPVWGPKYKSSWSLASATVGSKPLLVKFNLMFYKSVLN